MTSVNLSKLVAEALLQAKPPLNVSAIVAEVLRQSAPPVHVSAIVAEILRQAKPSVRTSTFDAEVLRKAKPSVRVSTIVTEVLHRFGPFPFPRRLAIQIATEDEFRPEERHFWIKPPPPPTPSPIGPYFFNYVNMLPSVAPLVLTRHATPGLP
jgi:hypothetical protein